MSQLIPFVFDNYEIRILTHDDGSPWWVLSDVCKALGILNPSDVVKRLESTDYLTLDSIYTGNNAGLLVVNETGLYRVIFRSDKPAAKIFQKWVFEEVLPAIRQTGSYTVSTEPPKPTFYNPQTQMLIETLTRLDAYEARQAEQQAALIAVQAQTIETQNLALAALQAQQWITIRQYVMSHRLGHQCTPSDQQAYAKWLGTHCLEIGMPMYKAFTADVSWPDERTYHAGTINTTLPGWLARRHAQPALAIVKETP